MRAAALLLLATACVEEPVAKDDGSADTGLSDLPDVDADRDGYPQEVDCDDSDAGVNPGASERCNGVDDDCDGAIDEAGTDATVWYYDDDGDGYGDPDDEEWGCTAPLGAVDNDLDCDDLNADVSPESVEVCNLADDDCDGDIDEEAIDTVEFFDDVDEDGFGDPATGHFACRPDSNDVTVADDCDDTTDQVNPAVPEICRDGLDNDCDGGPNTCGWRGDVLTSGAWGSIAAIADTDGLGRGLVPADLNGDGEAGVFVAARDHAGSSYYSGAVYGLAALSRGAQSVSSATVRYWGEGVGSLAGSDGGLWVGDTDGDGYDDVLVRGRSSAGLPRAYVMRGPHAGDSSLVSSDLVVSDVLGAGAVFSDGGIGDVTGDGAVELILSRPSTGDALIFDGDLSGARGPAEAFASLSLGGGAIAHSLLAAHDLNADGVSDVLLQGAATGGDARVLLFNAPLAGDLLAADAAATLSGDGLGFDTLEAGDLDNDGYEDILVSSFDGPGGELQLYFGPFGAVVGVPDVRIVGEGPDASVGAFASFLGDGDGDGRGELLVPVDGPSPYVRYYQSPNYGTYGLADGQARFLGGPERSFPIGDVNGDGFEDLALTASTAGGGVWLYWGGAI